MDPLETPIPAGYTKIPGTLNTADLQAAQFEDIRPVGTPGSAGSYLIGRPKAAGGLTPVFGGLFDTLEKQQGAFENIQQFGQTGEQGSYLAGKLKSPTVTLSDGKTYSIDPLTGKPTLVETGAGEAPPPGSETGTGVDSNDLKNFAESPNTPESITALIQSFESRNKELQKQILDTFKPSEKEAGVQKQIDDILTRTQAGLFNVEGRPIPIEDIGGEQERLLRNSNILLQPLQQELSRLSGGREAQGKGLTAALGFSAQNQELQLKMLDEIQKPMRAANEATQKFVLDLALKYPDSGITINDSAATASTKAANSRSFKQSVSADGKTQIVNTPQGTLLIDSKTGDIIRNYGPGGEETARKDQRANQLADQFVGLDVVKNFNLISTAVATVKALPADAATSADDQALLYAFAKAMDPNSVVREGEYNTIQKYSQSWLEQFGIQVQRVFENKPLFPDTPEGRQSRQNLKDTITTKYNAAKLQYENIRDSYAGQIDRVTGGADGADYLIDFSKFNATGTGTELDSRRNREQENAWSATVGSGQKAATNDGKTIHGVDTATTQRLAEAIGHVESGGRYNARGVVVTKGAYKGDRAYGKYQIMGRNVPSWTKAALGRSLTKEEFLNDPAAQDATARYQIALNLKRYGNVDDVASVWFTGRPASKGALASDDRGTTGANYVRMVRSRYDKLS